MTPTAFREASSVSRETLGRLETYADRLVRWQRAINLVSRSSLADLWRRHMLDSAQLFPMLPRRPRIVDIGSGAGFPGMVLAIMGAEGVHLVEADQRKAAFLRDVARAADVPVTILCARIEALPCLDADVVVARAVAPLKVLLGYAAAHLRSDGICLFLKGRTVDEELTDSRKIWNMRVDCQPSISDPSGSILRVGAIVSVR